MKMALLLSQHVISLHSSPLGILLIKGRKADWLDIYAHTLGSEAFVTGRLLAGSDEKSCLSCTSRRQNELLTKTECY